jgi:hypothetical protein
MRYEELVNDKYFGFWDCFCDRKALKGRAEKLMPVINFSIKNGITDKHNYDYSFKNCHIGHGGSFDIIQIAKIRDGKIDDLCNGFIRKDEVGKAQFWVSGKGYLANRQLLSNYELYTEDNGEYIAIKFENYQNMKNEILTNNELKNFMIEAFS